MLIPVKKKYKSVRRLSWIADRKIIHSLQLDCYKGHLPMKCKSCPISESCWFYCLKIVKE